MIDRRASLLLTATGLAVVALIAGACGGGDGSGPANGGEASPTVAAGDGAAAAGLRIVTSLGIFADFAREVGGDRVEVTSLLPPGADPHTFEATAGDVRAVAEADLVLVNGVGLEGRLGDTIAANVRDEKRIVYLSGVPPWAKIAVDDPHFWLDATQAAQYAARISDALVEADPDNAGYYVERGRDYAGRLRQLDLDILQKIASIQEERRLVITYHKSFSAFAARYGLEVAGYVVASPGGDASPGDVGDLVNEIRDRGIPAVFSEPQLNAPVLQQIADDSGAQVCTLYSDALDDRVATYVEMMRFNADELARCLGGEGGG